MNLGTVTVLYNCLIPEVDTPLADLVSHQILDAQKEVAVRAFICCSDHRSLGSKMIPKYLYDGIRLLVVDPSGFGLLKDRLPGIGSLYDLGKFISTVFVSSNGDLCVEDHSKQPPGLSIMSLSFVWHCTIVLPITSIIVSLTKLGDSSSSGNATSKAVHKCTRG